MKKILFYPIAVITLFLSSCEKEIDLNMDLDFSDFSWSGPIVFNTNIFDSTGFSYIQLPLNRYFIYKDETSGSTDSVAVTGSNYSAVYTGPSGSKPGYYYYTYDLTLTRFSAVNQTWYNGYASCDPDYKNTVTYIDSDFSLSNEPSKLPAFWYPFVSSGTQQYSFIPSAVIESNTYANVHSFSAGNGLQPTDPNYLATTFWWVKGIGIIKKVIRTSGSVKTSLLARHG